MGDLTFEIWWKEYCAANETAKASCDPETIASVAFAVGQANAPMQFGTMKPSMCVVSLCTSTDLCELEAQMNFLGSKGYSVQSLTTSTEPGPQVSAHSPAYDVTRYTAVMQWYGQEADKPVL